MSTEKFVENVLTQAQEAKTAGATKIVLGIDAVITSFNEAKQVAKAAPVLKKLEQLALDTDDLEVLNDIADLCQTLCLNATVVSSSDDKLFNNFENLINRLEDFDLFLEVKSDDNDMYNDDFDDEENECEDDNVVSSFRQSVAEETLFMEEIPDEAVTTKKKTWLDSILGR